MKTITQENSTATKPAHTPTPWILRMGSDRKTPVAFIDTKTDNTIVALEAMTAEGRKDFNANAALIVKCVNSHASLVALNEELVKVLREAQSDILIDQRRRRPDCAYTARMLGRIADVLTRAALAKAQA